MGNDLVSLLPEPRYDLCRAYTAYFAIHDLSHTYVLSLVLLEVDEDDMISRDSIARDLPYSETLETLDLAFDFAGFFVLEIGGCRAHTLRELP